MDSRIMICDWKDLKMFRNNFRYLDMIKDQKLIFECGSATQRTFYNLVSKMTFEEEDLMSAPRRKAENFKSGRWERDTSLMSNIIR